MSTQVPVIVGVGQVIQKDAAAPEALGPIELMVAAARRAGADAGASKLLGRIGWLAVVGGTWRYRNPGAVIAGHLGAPTAATALTGMSGSAPQNAVGVAAARIACGELDVALVVGGEARRSYRQLKRNNLPLPWTTDDGDGEAEHLTVLPPDIAAEPRQFGSIAALYALMEDSLRIAAGRSVPEHQAHIGALWEQFSVVARHNPMAWDRREWTAQQIIADTPDNRMIAFPYTKALVANNDVDMASAILITSLEAALAAGVSRDRLVFPHAVTVSDDTTRVAHRHRLHEAPALAAAGARALQLAGICAADLTHVDLYACFPSIVQMSAQALQLPLDRALTVTGGLGFAGAPLANASGQSIATLVPQVRAGGWGLVHANGGAAAKHAFGIYAPHPPDAFRFERVEDVDHRARAEMPDDWPGSVDVEAATVLYDRDGPASVLASVRAADRRRLVTTTDADTIKSVLADGIAGQAATIDAAGQLRLP